MLGTELQRTERAARVSASLMVAPIIAQPALVVAMMSWARHESILLHPAEAALNPPTVSRAIADPVIGDVFANWMLAGFALLLFCLWRIGVASYRPALSPGMKALWGTFLFSETVAAFGMVVLSQYTGSISDFWHTVGSYMLFFGHGIGISLWGVFVRFDRKNEVAPPLPYYPRLHPRLALVVASGALTFATVYYGWDSFKALDDLGTRTVFTTVEFALIVSFEIYLASFVVPLFHVERHRLRVRASLDRIEPLRRGDFAARAGDGRRA